MSGGRVRIFKTLSRLFGVYRPVRWVYRHLLAREGLRDFRRQLTFYSQFLGPDDLCFDVGADVGAKTEVFLKLGARVVAFEPQPDRMMELQARLGARPRLATVSAAVGASPGKATLYVRPYRPASSLRREWEGPVESTLEVPLTTLDDAIARYGKPRYCKIDVEGYEMEALTGLSRALDVLSFEYHLREQEVQRTVDCLSYLARLGDVRLNITAAESPVLLLSEWRSKDHFLDFFLKDLADRPAFSYGDIFVRMT